MVFPTKTLIIALSIVFKSTIFISQATAMTSPSQASAVKPLINHLLQQTKLVSQFYALRHGQSLANVEKIISSDPQVSTVKHGLSELGMEQARLAGRSFASNYCKRDGPTGSVSDLRGVAIFSSDFTRARETASIFAEELAKSKIPLYKDDIILETRLRERYFGDLNGGPDTRYQDVWNIDLKDADHTEFHVESANSVLHRTTKLVLELDEILERQQSAQSKGSDNTEDSRWKCILVAHGDVLQILQTGFLRHPDASRHRSLEHLETATIRELILPE